MKPYLYLFAFIWGFLCSPPSYTCTEDIFEPDGSCIIANSFITDGETQTHNFCSDAEDWIRFNACSGTGFTIATSNLGSSCDTYLEIYDSNCTTLLASDDNGGSGFASLINWSAPADGLYYIRVSSVGGMFGDNYEYDITLSGDTSPCALWFVDFDGFVSNPSRGVLKETSDGGSVYLTYTGSIPQFDPRILKLDRDGDIEWQRSFSIDSWDTSSEILQTTDGGYLFVGTSSDGTAVNEDWHVVKLDASGTILWHRVLGSGTSDSAYGVVEDPGTGYIIAGNSGSFGVGNGDGWAVKISTAGAILWQRAYGHTESDLFYAVEREAGGNLLFAGSTASFGAVDTDGWIIKTDTTGVILWDRRYGGNDLDIFYSVISTTDGGYLAAGRTGSSNPEGWLVKTDASGAVVWEYSYGSSYFDMFTSAIQTHDGGYIATGTMTIAASPQEYIWLVKIDSTGTVEWQKRYAATTDMRGQSIRQMPDEGYLVGTDRGMVIRIDGQGNTGAGCSYATNTVISPSATGFGSSATTSANVPTTATVTIPGVATPASAAAIEDACPCPYATASIANISPSASECAGTELTFTGSGSGLGSLTYQWDFDYDGAIFDVDAAGSIVNHTYNPAVDTSYTVALRVTDSCSWGPARAIDTSTVDIWVATVEISGPAGICREDGALLDAGAGFISYLWSPGGETAQTINVNPYLSADYSVDVTDSEGCSGNDTHSLAVWWNPVPTIEEYGNCGDIILDAGDGYTSYLWTPGGETTQTINIGSDTGTMYSVTVTNTFGCEGSDSHQATSTCPADRYEPNDACDSRPTLLHGGDLQVHNFCDDAEDWFVFYGAAGRAYTIETFNLCPSADTVLEIYDTDCSTLLASDDNGGTGVASKLEFTAPGHGSYHIRVRNVGGASGPDLGYEISLTGDTGPAQLWFRTFDVTAVTPIDRIFWTDTAPDGGLIVAGETINQGINDYDPWIFKLDSLGSIEWERKFIADIFSATIHSVPGGFYYLTHSDGTVMKLDDAGNTVWQKRVDCTLRSADLTLDDGIIIAGNVTNNFYAARLDASGTLLWQKSYGGAGNENAMEVVATSDGGFILAGSAGSFGTAPTHMWIVKTDSTGNIQWQRVYGADVGASAGAVAETEDGGFIVGGYTWFSGGLYDQLIMKLTPDGNIQWQTVLPDSASQDSASGVLQSYDSSYIALGSAGPSGSDSYFRLTGLDGDGSFLWQRTYSDGTGYLNAFHLLEDIDTSLVVDGYTDAFGVDISAGLVMKAGSNGSIDAACSIISSDASSFVDPFLDSSATAASASVASQTISDVTYSSAAVSSTSSEHCSTCLEAAALITEVLPSASACQGVEQTFTGTGFGQGALTYQWDFDYDGFTFDVMATGTTVQYTYPASGTYTAALRVRDTCPDGVQLSVDTFSVTIHPLPTPIISGPSGICEGDPPVVLDAGTGYAAYLWSPGGQTTRTISVDPASTTLYSVTVTTAEGCQGTDDHTLNVYQVPSPTVTETCFRDDIILDAGDGYVTYLWSPGGETTQTINVGNDTTTSYSVTVTYTGGCEGSDSHTASGPCSATGDIYENDDTSYSSETIIDEGVTQTHNFLDDAIDWIHFNACTAREYLIETSNPGILADTYLELYDTDGTTLLASDDNGGGDGVSSLINWTAPADGLYHIRVR